MPPGQEKDVYVYYPTLPDQSMQIFEATQDQLLEKRRALIQGMSHGASGVQVAEFGRLLRTQA